MVGELLERQARPIKLNNGKSKQDASSPDAPPSRILICAPSNAAIDEVAFRLKQGVRSSGGGLAIPNIVRIGAGDKISPLVKDLRLEELVATRVGNTDPVKPIDVNALRDNLRAMTRQINTLIEEIKSPDVVASRADEIQGLLNTLRFKRNGLSRELDAAKDRNETARRTRDGNLRRFEAEILASAQVICATLSGSGHSSLAPFNFETVVIDEAAQSVEISSLIPLKYGTRRAILVGGMLPLSILVILAGGNSQTNRPHRSAATGSYRSVSTGDSVSV